MTGFQSKRMMSEVRWLGPYAPSDRFMDDVTEANAPYIRHGSRINTMAIPFDIKGISNMTIKRRSFLAMLGLAPVAIATKAEPIAPANPEIVEAVAEGVVMANVRVPVKIGLTQEQADFCSEIGMDVHEYAKNLHELKQLNLIEGEVNTTVLYEEKNHDHRP